MKDNERILKDNMRQLRTTLDIFIIYDYPQSYHHPLNTTQRRRVRRDVFCQLIVLRTQRRTITARDRRDLQIPMRERK